MTILEKKNTVSPEDIIPGYQKASSLASGKYYLITYIASNGTIYVMYPFENYEKGYGFAMSNSIMNFHTENYS